MSEFAAALAKAQAEMKNASLNKVNPHFKSKYADLPEIRDAVLPILNKHGFAVVQTTRVVDGALMLVTKLIHATGEIEGEYPLPIAKPQEMGSAITYARRYTLAALVCIAADEDDDGEAAKDMTANAPQKPAQRQSNGEAPSQRSDAYKRCVAALWAAIDVDERDGFGALNDFTPADANRVLDDYREAAKVITGSADAKGMPDFERKGFVRIRDEIGNALKGLIEQGNLAA